MHSSSKTALLFSAHPDDHICAAGTLMLLRERGFTIKEYVATGGEKGIWWEADGQKKQGFDKKQLAEERRKEIARASEIIGISETQFLGLPDSEIERSFSIVERIQGIVRAERPDIVFTMSPEDYHHDHREIGKIVVEGADRASWSGSPELGSPWKIPLMLYMEGFHFVDAHVVVDVTRFSERKRELLDVYASQIEPGERRLLDSMTTYRGFFQRDKNVMSAEAFELPKEFPVNLNALMDMFHS